MKSNIPLVFAMLGAVDGPCGKSIMEFAMDESSLPSWEELDAMITEVYGDPRDGKGEGNDESNRP